MQKKITWIGLDVSEAVEEAVNNSLAGVKKVSKHIDSIQTILRFSESENPKCKAEFIVSIRGKVIVSKATSNDMYSAILSASDKTKKQMIKANQKNKSLRSTKEKLRMMQDEALT